MMNHSGLVADRPVAGTHSFRHGFTMLEMLTVLSVIAILLALLLPTVTRARHQAKTAVCASQLRQIYEAMQQVELTARSSSTPSGDAYNLPAVGWRYITRPYLQNSRIFICPEDNRTSMTGDDGTGLSGTSAGAGATNGLNPTGGTPGQAAGSNNLPSLATCYIYCPQNQTTKLLAPGPWVEVTNVTANSYQLMYEDGYDNNFTDVEMLLTDNGDGTVTITLATNGNPGWKNDVVIDGMTGNTLKGTDGTLWAYLYNTSTTPPGPQPGATTIVRGSLKDPTTGTITAVADFGAHQGAINLTNGSNGPYAGFGEECSYGMNGCTATLTKIMGRGDKILGLDYVNETVLIDDEWTVAPWLSPSGNGGVSFARHNNRCNVLWADGSVRPSEQDIKQQGIFMGGVTTGGTYSGENYTNAARSMWFAPGEFNTN